MKTKTKVKKDKRREWRLVYLTIAGKHLDPKKVTETLNVLPDNWGKLGELYRKNRKCKQGYWSLEGGPPTWRIETQIKSILKRIAPAKHQLRKLIKEDNTVQRAYLTIAAAPPREFAEANYCFEAKLINEFTSMGIDIAFSIEIVERWDRIFRKAAKRKKSKTVHH